MIKAKIVTECPEPPVSLPAKLSSIRIQATKKDRCSLFVGETFVIGIDQLVLMEYGFKKGDELQPEQWEALWEREQVQKVFHWMLSRLEQRAHAQLELKQKASQKGFPSKWVEPAIDKVNRLGLLDDEQFARLFVRDKFKFKRWGWVKMVFELKKKGISDSIIKLVQQEFSSEIDSKEEIQKLIQKRERHFSREEDLQKRKRKMMNYLAGKGYSMSDILAVLR